MRFPPFVFNHKQTGGGCLVYPQVKDA